MEEAATTEESSVVQTEGLRRVQRKVRQYNLDVIVSVAYRVNSRKGVQFRQWATRVLREHLTRGFTLNRQCFEVNAHELEAALTLVRRLAVSPDLGAEGGRVPTGNTWALYRFGSGERRPGLAWSVRV